MIRIDNFYKFNIKHSKSTAQVSAQNVDKKMGQYDSWISRLLRGDYETFTFPIIFRHVAGSKFADIISTQTGCLHLISKNLAEFMISENLTGFKLFNTIVLDKSGQENLKYYGLSITGVCGPPDFKKSIQYTKVDFLGNNRNYFKGYPIDLDSWDGSDLFTPGGTNAILMRENVVEKLSHKKISNFFPIKLSDWEMEENSMMHR